jgi:hypothetical protein
MSEISSPVIRGRNEAADFCQKAGALLEPHGRPKAVSAEILRHSFAISAMLVNAKVQRDFIHAQAERFHEFLAKNFSGEDRRYFLSHSQVPGVINDFDMQCFALAT